MSEIPHVDDVNTITEVEIISKIAGVSSVILSFHCISCEKKVINIETKILECQDCHSKMLKSKFRNNHSTSLLDIIGSSTLDETLITKSLLEFDKPLEITFDFTSKTVSSVKLC